ncbi:MAG: sulfatase [Planctomycetota bacterium]
MRRAITALVLLAACGKSAPDHPNVLLVTIDTLRPDSVGAEHGTPAMVAFLAEATRFPRARSVAPMTLPAHASMFTGLLPTAHGLHDNVTEPLPEERPFPLLAEQFRDAGYDTAAFIACGVLGSGTGIAYGFDVYDCPQDYDQRRDESVPGEERVKAAIKYMEGARGRPWFVWVHLFDPHAPYDPYPGDARRPAAREGDPPYALYLGDVRRADAAFEKLIAAAGGAVTVLASDHGESFGEHDELSHGPLCYGATVDALLAVRAPGFEPGAVDRGLRSVADIAPTLRRLCSLPAVPSDGRDLRGPPHETLVAESLFVSGIHGWGQCFAVTDGDFSLVESGPRRELFDRRGDPLELQPLPLSLPAYEKLDRALERFRSGPLVVHDGELRASIPAYGQMRRTTTRYLPRHENARLIDPRLYLTLWMHVEEVPWVVDMAKERRDVAPLDAALRLLANFERSSPASPLVPFRRAAVCEAMADITGDRSWLKTAARAHVEAVEKGYSREGPIREAIRCAVAAEDPESLQRLATFLRKDGARLDPGIASALDEAAARIDTSASHPPIPGR